MAMIPLATNCTSVDFPELKRGETKVIETVTYQGQEIIHVHQVIGPIPMVNPWFSVEKNQNYCTHLFIYDNDKMPKNPPKMDISHLVEN